MFEVQKITENVDSKLCKTKNGRTVLISKCTVCSSKKSKFMRGQKEKEILSSLCLKTPSSKIPSYWEILF